MIRILEQHVFPRNNGPRAGKVPRTSHGKNKGKKKPRTTEKNPNCHSNLQPSQQQETLLNVPVTEARQRGRAAMDVCEWMVLHEVMTNELSFYIIQSRK